MSDNIRAMLDSLGDGQKPSAKDNWLTLEELLPYAEDLTPEQIRDRLEFGVRNGTHEKTKWGRNVYYRQVKADHAA